MSGYSNVTYEEIAVGATASAERVLGQSEIEALLLVSGDVVPFHVEEGSAAVEPGEFLVRDGKIAFVGTEIPAEARGRARSVRFSDATIVPGFVVAHATFDLERELAERAVALTPDLLAKDAFDPADEKLARLPSLRSLTSGAPNPINGASVQETSWPDLNARLR